MQRTLENRTEFTRNGENQLGRWDYEAIQMLDEFYKLSAAGTTDYIQELEEDWTILQAIYLDVDDEDLDSLDDEDDYNDRINGTADDVIVIGSDNDDLSKSRISNHNKLRVEYTKPQFSVKCKVCDKSLTTNYNLKRHMMIHTGEHPYSCDICNKRLREFSDLKKHRWTHIRNSSFNCMMCHKKKPTADSSTLCDDCDRQMFIDGMHKNDRVAKKKKTELKKRWKSKALFRIKLK